MSIIKKIRENFQKKNKQVKDIKIFLKKKKRNDKKRPKISNIT